MENENFEVNLECLNDFCIDSVLSFVRKLKEKKNIVRCFIYLVFFQNRKPRMSVFIYVPSKSYAWFCVDACVSTSDSLNSLHHDDNHLRDILYASGTWSSTLRTHNKSNPIT